MGGSSCLLALAGTYPLPVLTVSSMPSVAPSSRVQITWSGFIISTPLTRLIMPAVTTQGPSAFKRRRFGPSTDILTATPLRLSTMSVTSSLTPAMDENSCRTPCIWIDVMAAPCKEDSRTRLKELPTVTPNPRSNGSIVIVALLLLCSS